MHQNWGKLLFMHWRIEESLLRPIIPPDLKIETFDGSAWIAIVPFTMWDIRAFPPYIPPLPYLNAAHELNVRTYVSFEGISGVWFLSLDCNSSAAVLGARTFYYLPYFNAEIELNQDQTSIDYQLHRTDKPAADFRAEWTIGSALPTSQPNSLEFFLTERYCLFTEHNGEIYRCRIYHPQWSLQNANLLSFTSTMIESHSLPAPSGEPLLHYAESISVDIWSLKKVSES
jgi:uncharacterized protein YqjF (DUF2071 family)